MINDMAVNEYEKLLSVVDVILLCSEGSFLDVENHDQLKIRPYILPLVSKNRRYRILNGID